MDVRNEASGDADVMVQAGVIGGTSNPGVRVHNVAKDRARVAVQSGRINGAVRVDGAVIEGDTQ